VLNNTTMQSARWCTKTNAISDNNQSFLVILSDIYCRYSDGVTRHKNFLLITLYTRIITLNYRSILTLYKKYTRNKVWQLQSSVTIDHIHDVTVNDVGLPDSNCRNIGDFLTSRHARQFVTHVHSKPV